MRLDAQSFNVKRVSVVIALVLGSLGLPFWSAAQTDRTPIAYGSYRVLHSTALGEDRRLLVRLPNDYEKSDRKYPVLYKLDGARDVFVQTSAAVDYLADMRDPIPDQIVIGIENTDRERDMTPGPGADKFIQFVGTELIPFVDRQYRTSGFRTLAGQSASSILALYCFIKSPDLFDGYILGSFGLRRRPTVESLFQVELKKSPSLRTPLKRYVFVTNGANDGYDPDGSRTSNGTEFLTTLRQAVSATVLVKYTVYKDEGHVPFPTVYDGLKWIYSQQSTAPKGTGGGR